MKDTGVLELIIPEIKATYDFNQYNPHHTLDLFSHIVSVVEKVPSRYGTSLCSSFTRYRKTCCSNFR